MRRVSTNPSVAGELVPLFKRHLELCKVKPGESFLAFTNTQTNPNYAAAMLGAAGMLGADAYQITVPANNDWMESRAIIEAWKAADFVVGLLQSTNTHWIYSDAHNEALDAGTRTLMVEEPEDILERLFPDEGIRRRGEAGAKILEPGKSIRITSDAGTDLTVSKVGRKAAVQYGISDVAGRWDHWPSGMISTAPIENSAEGTLVIDEGDVLVPLGRYVDSPVKVTFHEGRAQGFEGGADARLMRDYFEAGGDDGAYLLSHLGWGNEHRARWSAIGLRFWEGGGVMDAESFYQNVLIAFGSNFFRNLGGDNHAAFHFDIPMRNNSLWVDDVQVLDHGRFVREELVAG
jgi:2,5-dihydroxypyridine 5,6-dioxygenase